MEAIVLCGIQGSGKTTLYRDRYLETHVRISGDLLRTAYRERRFLELCLETGQPFVVDKTNATPQHRAPYVAAGKAAGFRVVGCVVEVDTAEAVRRNALRDARRRVPLAGLYGTRRDFVTPTLGEGFDALLRARPDGTGGWRVEPLETPPEPPA